MYLFLFLIVMIIRINDNIWKLASKQFVSKLVFKCKIVWLESIKHGTCLFQETYYQTGTWMLYNG